MLMFSLSAEVCDTAANAVIVIPGMSHDGISALPLIGDLAGVNAPVTAIASAAIASTSQAFLAAQCGGLFGAYGTHIPIAAIAATTTFGRLVVTPATATRSPECLVCKCTLNLTINGFHIIKFYIIASYISPLHSAARVQPFTVGVVQGAPTAQAKNNGFKLDYTQVSLI